MWFIGVEVAQETSAPPPKKNPGSAPGDLDPGGHISFTSWVGWVQKAYKWTDSSCQWCPCMLTSELNVNMLIDIVKRARLLSSHPRLLPSFLLPAFQEHTKDKRGTRVPWFETREGMWKTRAQYPHKYLDFIGLQAIRMHSSSTNAR